MNDYQIRVIDEKTSLSNRLSMLRAFFHNPIYHRLPEAEQLRLRYQEKFMTGYLDTLLLRIAAFEV